MNIGKILFNGSMYQLGFTCLQISVLIFCILIVNAILKYTNKIINKK